MLTCENPRCHTATLDGGFLLLPFIIASEVSAWFVLMSEPQRRGVKMNYTDVWMKLDFSSTSKM